MLEDFRLKVFVTVAQEKSFTKAAQALGVSQPAVSQNISELERVTGVKLFERLRGEVAMTPAGEVFLKYASRILGAYHSASSVFSPVKPAVVRINASDELYAYIEDSLSLFMQIHPEVEILRSEDEDSELSFHLTMTPKIMGGISATHNVISSMSLICRPSESFAQSELFSILRGFISDIIC